MSRPTKSRAQRADDQGRNLPLTRDEAERILRAPAGKRFSLPSDWDERVEYLALALNKLTAHIADLSRPAYIGISPEDRADARRAEGALVELQSRTEGLLPADLKRCLGRVRTAVDGRISFADLDKRKRARPAMHHLGVAYPFLLAFHGRVYGRAPKRRFMQDYFRLDVVPEAKPLSSKARARPPKPASPG